MPAAVVVAVAPVAVIAAARSNAGNYHQLLKKSIVVGVVAVVFTVAAVAVFAVAAVAVVFTIDGHGQQ